MFNKHVFNFFLENINSFLSFLTSTKGIMVVASLLQESIMDNLVSGYAISFLCNFVQVLVNMVLE